MDRSAGAARGILTVALLVGCLVVPSLAQSRKRPAPARAVSTRETPDTTALTAMHYRYIGPEGNRTDAIAGVKGDPNVYYVGAASGGLWKTTDAGAHWDPIFDGQPVSSIGAIAIAPIRSECRVGRHGRVVHSKPHLDRLRHVPLDGRRQDVVAHRAREDRAHCAHRRRSNESRPGARRRARPRVRSATGARHSFARSTAARIGSVSSS